MGISPREAKAALQAVLELSESVSWVPRRWPAVVLGMVYAFTGTVAVWERYPWFVAGLAVLGVLLLALRRLLFNPLVRVRPWQHLDKLAATGAWGPALWAMWIPVASLVSDLPTWVGPVVGTLAGIHTYWILRQLGDRR